MTPAVKRAVVLILPATFGGGHLPDQPVLLRLLRLPARRGLARLSQLCRPAEPAAAGDHRHRARHRDPARRSAAAIDRVATRTAARVQGRAFELAHAADPARRARAGGDAPGRSSRALFQGGRFTAEDAAITANVLAILVTGLPGLCADQGADPRLLRAARTCRRRCGSRSRCWSPASPPTSLLIPLIGIFSLADRRPPPAPGSTSWLLLRRSCAARGHFRVDRLARRAGSSRQLLAAVAMAAVLLPAARAARRPVRRLGVERLVSASARWSAPAARVYFGLAWAIGGMDRDDILDPVPKRKQRSEA